MDEAESNRTGLNFTSTKFTNKIWLFYLWAEKGHLVVRVNRHQTLSLRTFSHLLQSNVTSTIINQKIFLKEAVNSEESQKFGIGRDFTDYLVPTLVL